MDDNRENNPEEFWEEMLNSPDPGETEAILKKMEAKAQQESQESFADAIAKKVWRTKDGRFINISDMDDNHLLNAIHQVETGIKKYLVAKNAGYKDEEHQKVIDQLKKTGSTEKHHLDSGLTAQVKGLHYLQEEAVSRNLFAKILSEKVDDVFDTFKEIINTKDIEE